MPPPKGFVVHSKWGLLSTHEDKTQKCEGFNSPSQEILTSGKGRQKIKIFPFPGLNGMSQGRAHVATRETVLQDNSHIQSAPASLRKHCHIIISFCSFSLLLAWHSCWLGLHFFTESVVACDSVLRALLSFEPYTRHKKEELLNF